MDSIDPEDFEYPIKIKPYPMPDMRDIEFLEPELPKSVKIKCVECKKIRAVEPPENQRALPSYKNNLYCPTCWQIKKLKE